MSARAVVAMVAAVVVLVLTGCGSTQGPPAPCGNVQSPEPSGWAGDPAAIASYVASGRIPPYYVTVSEDGGYAYVLKTTTGATLATIKAPVAGTDVATATGARDDRTFVLETQPEGMMSNQPDAFYLLQLSSSGRPGALRRLPVSVPDGQQLRGLALSPDADRLALATMSDATAEEYGITVDTLATGAVRTWTAKDLPGFATESTLAWTQDERTLSFAGFAHTGVRLLDLDAPGGDLLASSRAVVFGTDRGWACSQPPVITPDGKALACGASPSAASAGDQAAVAEYSAADGAPERVLGRHLGYSAASTLWENTSGSIVIGGINGPFQSCPTALPPTAGVFTANRFIALPGMPEWLVGTYVW